MSDLRKYINLFEDATTQFASMAHDEWRKGYIAREGNKPREKKVPAGYPDAGQMVDINVPFKEVHPHYQKDNIEAAKAAKAAVEMFPDDIEKGSAFIHTEWVKRNPWADEKLKVSYEELPEIEKEKDRVHYRLMKQLMGQ